jgi:hypothetical protein
MDGPMTLKQILDAPKPARYTGAQVKEALGGHPFYIFGTEAELAKSEAVFPLSSLKDTDTIEVRTSKQHAGFDWVIL